MLKFLQCIEACGQFSAHLHKPIFTVLTADIATNPESIPSSTAWTSRNFLAAMCTANAVSPAEDAPRVRATHTWQKKMWGGTSELVGVAVDSPFQKETRAETMGMESGGCAIAQTEVKPMDS